MIRVDLDELEGLAARLDRVAAALRATKGRLRLGADEVGDERLAGALEDFWDRAERHLRAVDEAVSAVGPALRGAAATYRQVEEAVAAAAGPSR